MKGFILHVIGHIKITRTRRMSYWALFDERIYMHVIGHIKITRTRRRVALFDERIYMHWLLRRTRGRVALFDERFICMLLDILR